MTVTASWKKYIFKLKGQQVSRQSTKLENMKEKIKKLKRLRNKLMI